MTYEYLKEFIEKDSSKDSSFVYPVIDKKHESRFIGTIERTEILKIIRDLEAKSESERKKKVNTYIYNISSNVLLLLLFL